MQRIVAAAATTKAPKSGVRETCEGSFIGLLPFTIDRAGRLAVYSAASGSENQKVVTLFGSLS